MVIGHGFDLPCKWVIHAASPTYFLFLRVRDAQRVLYAHSSDGARGKPAVELLPRSADAEHQEGHPDDRVPLSGDTRAPLPGGGGLANGSADDSERAERAARRLRAHRAVHAERAGHSGGPLGAGRVAGTGNGLACFLQTLDITQLGQLVLTNTSNPQSQPPFVSDKHSKSSIATSLYFNKHFKSPNHDLPLFQQTLQILNRNLPLFQNNTPILSLQ